MMKFEPIGSSGDHAIALRLLSEGFPERTGDFWREGLLRATPIARRLGNPIGQILISKGVPSGIILTFRSSRPDRSLPIVNLSAWYLAEPKRFLAPGMLKSVTTEPATYTDLTPTHQVARVSEALGFRAMTQASAVAPLAVSAFLPRGPSQIVAWRRLTVPDPLAQMAEDHESLGCIVLGVRTGDQSDLIVARRTRYLRLPAAEIIYARRSTLRAAISPIARTLLRQGIVNLLYDCGVRADALPLSIFRRSHMQRLIKGDDFDDRIDYAWSELLFLNP
jgi:hypothetical protein